ncbi:MAG: hypothetical protein JWR09_834 [Mucilaginibacter sp.]|nr:hypothetical protein [Mucilaginibacter sp.]
MRNNIILILLVLFSPLILSGQIKGLNYTKIGNYIIHNYRPDSAALSKFCRIGCIFIRFNVNQKGDIANLSFSGDTDSIKFITDALTISLDFLKQDASLINFLKTSGRTIIQPFTYNYQAGCNFPEAGVKNTNDYFESYLNIMLDLDHTAISLFHMLKFKGEDMQFFDGVLLHPLVVNNVVMH